MIELIVDPYFHLAIWLSLTFLCLANASIATSLFGFCRKYSVLINAIVIYIFFFVAFSQYLIWQDKLIEVAKAAHEPEVLSINAAVMLVILALVIFILNIVSIIQNGKGYKAARADIVASVKALIPANSTWKPEQGLTENIIKKYRITEAEQAAANLALLGKSNKEIANMLHKAVSTVEAQLKSVYQKTEAPGRYALIALTAQSTTAGNEEKAPK
ncbi:MAG: LuxR C-terminal-related transcriptional regulator [Treponema sp.]|nr:LuxR C-terminal-related transcriptional regulator [Treponema sp.]